MVTVNQIKGYCIKRRIELKEEYDKIPPGDESRISEKVENLAQRVAFGEVLFLIRNGGTTK